MPYLSADGLSTLDWVDHGFGTRLVPLADIKTASMKQIHSSLVLRADFPGECVGEGDALVTNQAGTAVSVRTADCYPILLADTRHRAVAAVHAGWRGTAAHIVLRTLERMSVEFDTDPADIFAAIGPGIGACCYEIGEEVARQFGLEGRIHLDLASENRKQLAAAGVHAHNIEALGVCNFCDTERFFSYRRQKEQAGRMISFILIQPENPSEN